MKQAALTFGTIVIWFWVFTGAFYILGLRACPASGATWTGKKGLGGTIVFSGRVIESASMEMIDNDGVIAYKVRMPEGSYSGSFEVFPGEDVMLALNVNGPTLTAKTPPMYFVGASNILDNPPLPDTIVKKAER